MSEVQGDNPNFFFQRCTFSWVLENPTLAFTSIKHVQNPIFWALDFKTSKGFFRHRPAKHRLPTQVLEVALCISWWWTKQEVGRTTKQERSERWWAGEGYRSYMHIISIIYYNIVLYTWEINHLNHLHVSYTFDGFPHCIKMDFWHRSCTVTQTTKKSRTAGNSTEKVKTMSIRPTLSLMPPELQRERSVLQVSSFVDGGNTPSSDG